MARRRTRRLAAFTLIELLVVIGIIAVLAGIGMAVGNGVIESNRAATTQNTIMLLEGYLSDLDAAGVDKRSYKAFSTEVDGNAYVLPVLDGRESGADFVLDDPASAPFDSLARFIAAGDAFLGDSSERWGGLDSTQTRDVALFDDGTVLLRGIALTDQWDRPIRAVHPSYDGGFGRYQNENGAVTSRDTLSVDEVIAGSTNSFNFRRSYRPFASGNTEGFVGDADEGICQNERMYFYSAGADGDPGTRDDNIYSATTTPQYPAETRNLD